MQVRRSHAKPFLAGGIVILVLGVGVAPGQSEKVRIFVTDSQSWQVSGGVGVSSGDGGGGLSGGARPQTAEIIKTFDKRCPFLTVTIKKENADYVVLLDHEGGKEVFLRDNKLAVFHKDGDLIYSGSTRSLGNAVKDACGAIARERAARP